MKVQILLTTQLKETPIHPANPDPVTSTSPRYTSFSELYPILAAGNLPFVKVGEISQTINTNAQLLSNTVTFESPVSTSTFVAEASFEVRSPMRLQVQNLRRIIRLIIRLLIMQFLARFSES